MTSPFAAPAAPGAGIDLKTLNGALLLFTVHEQVQGIATVHGPSDAIRCDVAVLDGGSAGDEYTDTLIFPKVLQGQLRPSVGGKVLGRLGQGVAKPGQSAPWVLSAATPADTQIGMAYVSRQLAAPAAAGATAGTAIPPF
jgi:hypothetical protein